MILIFTSLISLLLGRVPNNPNLWFGKFKTWLINSYPFQTRLNWKEKEKENKLYAIISRKNPVNNPQLSHVGILTAIEDRSLMKCTFGFPIQDEMKNRLLMSHGKKIRIFLLWDYPFKKVNEWQCASYCVT